MNDLLGELIIAFQQRMEWLWDKLSVQKLEDTCGTPDTVNKSGQEEETFGACRKASKHGLCPSKILIFCCVIPLTAIINHSEVFQYFLDLCVHCNAL
jgi:hypothetical protein